MPRNSSCESAPVLALDSSVGAAYSRLDVAEGGGVPGGVDVLDLPAPPPQALKQGWWWCGIPASSPGVRRAYVASVGLALLLTLVVAVSVAASGKRSQPAPPTTWSNWDRSESCTPLSIVSATSEADVLSVLSSAAATGVAVKVVGSGHSFSPIDQAQGSVMLRLVPPPLSDPAALAQLSADVVRVHAGLTLAQVNGALGGLGLALANLGAISSQTVAGATATNTHGTGHRASGGLSSFIVGARVCYAGNVSGGVCVSASATSNAALFSAVRTGYGALGILVSVDLAVVPIWMMEQVVAPVASLGVLLTALPALLTQYDRLQWHFLPYQGAAAAEGASNTLAPAYLIVRADAAAASGPSGPNGEGCWGGAGGSYAAPVTLPPTAPGFNGAWPSGSDACLDVSYKTLTGAGDDAALYAEMEMNVPIADAATVVGQLVTFLDDPLVKAQHDPSRNTLYVLVCYVGADDILLSPFYGRDTAVVSFIVIGDATQTGSLDEVTLFMTQLQSIATACCSARPHPGKINWFNASMMAAAFPSTYAAFVNIKNQVDPQGMFSNPYIAGLFG